METALFRRRPALKLVLLLSFGILLARYSTLDPVFVLIFTAALFISAVITAKFFSQKMVVDGLLCAIVVSLGACLQSYQQEDFGSRKLIPLSENEMIVFEGVVAEEPSVRTNRTQFVLEVTKVGRAGILQHLNRRIILYGKSDLLEHVAKQVEVGSVVYGKGVVDDYPRQRNPGEFDYGRYLELNGIHGIIVVKDTVALYVSQSTTRQWWTFTKNLRSQLLQSIDRMHSERSASFLRGLLLADRSKIPADVKQSFVETGTIHVLAVSGLHVGVVALMFYGFFGLLRLPRKMSVAATIAGLVFYMFLVGAPPSVVRATIMAIVLLIGPMIERKIDVYQSLSVAALILLLWDSNNLFNVGFQLSFAAVLSIVYFYPMFSRLIERLTEHTGRMRFIKPVLQLFAVSLAAQIGTLPFTAYYFDRVSIVSLAANVFVVPAVGLNVMLGFSTLGLSAVSTSLAENYAVLNDVLVSWLLEAVKYTAEVPYASVHTAQFEASFSLFYYAGVLGLVNLQNRKAVKTLLILTLLLVNVVVYARVFRTEDAKLKVTFIDVWQGDAILLELPSGEKVLLDAGGRTDTFDSGERTVAPFLRYKGINRLDAVIMSHPHSDHIGGVPYLLDHVAVNKIIEPTVPGESATYREIHSKAAEYSIPVLTYDAGEIIDLGDAVRLYVLHPYYQTDSTESLNNVSLVLKLEYCSSSLLFAGDAEKSVEEKLLARYGSFVRSDVLKVGHHGSRTSTGQNFAGLVQPGIAVISSGKNNKFGHPAPEVLSILRKQGVEVHRTDKEGAIVMESDGQQFRVVDWREE